MSNAPCVLGTPPVGSSSTRLDRLEAEIQLLELHLSDAEMAAAHRAVKQVLPLYASVITFREAYKTKLLALLGGKYED